MKTIMMYVLLVLFTSTESGPEILGTWLIPDENVKVEITCDGDVCTGVVVKAPKDVIIGKEILRDLKERNGKWKGKFYAIRKDKLLNAELNPNGDELDVEVSAGLGSKSFTWTRVD